ncbi:MAG: amino acid adenylation domain-containing protein [Ruminiclostridium sp.]|nr:amino acid adenylation domain-containing protein [Ruminiclostridium sp.]
MGGNVEYYPLTHPQKGIWYTEKLYPGTGIGNISGTIKIKGDIDYSLLEKAVNLMLEKNDSLRLRIIQKDNDINQYVSPYIYCKLDYFDFSEQGLDKLYEWDTFQTQTPFLNFDSDLFYFALIKMNDNFGGIYVRLHHIIGDAWSMVMLSEIMRYYNNLSNGTVINESNKPSYIEYILDEEHYINSNRFHKDKEFWNEKYKTIPDLTTIKVSKSNDSYIRAKRKTFIVPARLSLKIREYCRDNKTSVFVLFYAALSMYINRITSKEDLVFGTLVLNRSNVREKETMGMFMSIAPVRIKVNGNLKFISFVDEISKEWMSILRHQKYPFDLLMCDLREANKGMEKLYDIILNYQNAKLCKTDGNISYEGRWHVNGCQTESLRIHLNDREDDGNIILDYDYLCDLFHAKEIEFIHDHIIRLLWHALDNPLKEICRIEMISEKEKYKVLYDFNNTAFNYPMNKTIHQLFEEQVERTPENIAIIFEDIQMTYSELNKKSNQLAGALRGKGVKPDSIVGLMVHRSPEMIIGLLGILKAGGAFLPCDHEYPDERISFMLEDSKAGILITNKCFDKRINFVGNKVYIDHNDVYDMDGTNLSLVNKPSDLAYVIYTSGTTGNPKGVMIEHKAINNFVHGISCFMNYSPGIPAITMTTMSFDVFICEVMPSIVKGLKLIIAGEEQQKIPKLLSQLITRHRIEKMVATPSKIQLLVDDEECKWCLRYMKEIIVGGEVFTDKLRTKLKAVTDAKVFNGYGPTEATVGVTFKDITDDKKITIGKPIANTRIYILDSNRIPVPIGVSGEVYIGGDSVSRGYLNRVQLTNERFIPNPFIHSDIIYKTGDLARWYPKGEIEFLGRIDQQVKIRGYRIELAEIENKLSECKFVKEAVVIDREDINGKKYLCAYFVSDTNLTISQIKAFLSRDLPYYMVPSIFVKVDSIPLTQNGKVDRRRLPEVSGCELKDSEYEAPRNEIEEKLAEIWSKVLGMGNIGINDSFFDIGGDSLSVIQVQTAVFQYNWNLTTQDFYKYQTIKSLSDKIRGIIEDFKVDEEEVRQEIAFTGEYDVKRLFGLDGVNSFNGFFLTGATGYLGIHLLHELIHQTDANVYCLVRGKTRDEASSRLKKLLKFYFSSDYGELFDKRIFILNGDIIYEKFGLTNERYDYLAQNVDAVIHSAGLIKHYGKYDPSEKVNVGGTAEVVNFALKNRKMLYYMSTLSVSGHYLVRQSENEVTFTENNFYIGQHYKDNIYVRSKFEAEELVHEAIKHGLEAIIFRLGNISGRYSDGHFQINADENAFYNIIKSIIRLGYISDVLLDQSVDFSPVDCCAKAIVKIIFAKEYCGRVFHICNEKGTKMSELINMIVKLGIKVEVLSKESFRDYIEEISQDILQRENLRGVINDFNGEKQLDYKTSVIIKSDKTVEYLKQLGFKWPEIDKGYIGSIIDYLKRIDFFTKQ